MRCPASAHRADRPQLGPPVVVVLQQGAADAVVAPAFVTDDVDAECAAVRAGLGFGQLAGPLAEPLLQSGELVAVLDAEAPEPWPIHVYRSQRAPVPARVRLVYDALVRALR
jgi:DNA-binding transcriptional LysR family regulator